MCATSAGLQVAGNPHLQLGEEVAMQLSAMKGTPGHPGAPERVSPPPATVSAPRVVPPRPPPRAPCDSGASQAPPGGQGESSPGLMEEYFHWSFGKDPCQGPRRALGQPCYTDDQHSGGWLDTRGLLHMRRHGVNSLPSGATPLL